MAETDNVPSGAYQGYGGYEGYGSLSMRQRLTLAMLQRQKAYPKNIGEGIASVGQSIGDIIMANKLADAERQAMQYEGGAVKSLPAGDTPYAPPGAARPATPTATAAASPFDRPAGALPPIGRGEQQSPLGGWFANKGLDPRYPFDQASGGQPASTPAQPAGDETVPLPPRRPVYDRNVQIQELQDNPELTPRLLAMARGEVGADPNKQRIQLETVFNRAAARGTSLARELETNRGPGSRGYYPPETFGRGQADPSVLTDVLRGSNAGGEALGFAPTGNASGGVAERGVASGRYGNAGRIGGETYVTQRGPDNLARLEASRVPGQPLDIASQEQSATASPLPADVRSAIASAMLPPSASPLVQIAALPATTATDADPERPQLPADATAEVRNPMIVTDAIKKAPEPLPSQEPVPQAAPPYVTQIPPDPKRPQPLQWSDAQRRAFEIANDPRLDPQGAAVRRATQVFTAQEALRKELEAQQQADYSKEVARIDALKVKKEQRDYEEAPRILKEYGDRLDAELKIAQINQQPLLVAKLQQEIRENNVKYAQALQTLRKPETHVINEQILQRTPAIPEIPGVSGAQEAGPFAPAPGSPPAKKPALTTEQAKAVTFVRDVLPDMDLLETKLNHGMALTHLLPAAGSTLGGFVGLQNVTTTQEYKDAANALGRFKGAVMQHLSGTAVSPSEAERNLPAFIPRYGDNKEEVLRKAERRRNYVNAVYETASDPGKDAIHVGRKLVMDANGELPPVRITSQEPKGQKAELEKLGAGQYAILPDGEIVRVPWPKNLLPK